jgi:hypothetical protein
MAACRAHYNENLMALGIYTDVHADRVPSKAQAVHAALRASNYWIRN